MGKIWFLLYNIFLVPALFVFYQLGRFFNGKIADGIAGRKNQLKDIKNAVTAAGEHRTRILFHCVSVGEWEQAVPVITRLKQADPDIFIIVSFFSPSGFNYLGEHSAVDLKVYLPFDSYARARSFLMTLQPDMWMVVKHDIWPNHLFAARSLTIPTVLIDATLPANSLRIAPVIRNFYRHVFNAFHYVFPISEEDSERFSLIYPYPERRVVSGDTRFDRVYYRGQNALDNAGIPLFQGDGARTFIAGSTWPSDEKHVLPAVSRLLRKYDFLNIIIVPHEPDPRRIEAIESSLSAASISSQRYSEIENNGSGSSRVAIVDRVGLLAELYSRSDIAFVGGSFGPGVHNVMEPGILGKPVLFGPKHINSHEAGELIKNGGGFSVSSGSEIADKVGEFLENPQKRERAGRQAQQLIQKSLGATEAIYAKLKEIYDCIPKENTD